MGRNAQKCFSVAKENKKTYPWLHPPLPQGGKIQKLDNKNEIMLFKI